MTTMQETRITSESESRLDPENPFAEVDSQSEDGPARGTIGFLPWTENLTPFVEGIEASPEATETEAMLAAAFAELRDELFDEAVANLAAETESAVADRFTTESYGQAAERERFADAHLMPVRFEAEQYLDQLEVGIAGSDLESLDESQLDELLDRFDPSPSELSPAGEEFLGALVRKAKSVVKLVGNAAKKTVGKVAGTLMGPVLQKLRRLIRPLLRRVLSFAIGRLPAPLQPAARALATRITSEDESDSAEAFAASPAVTSDLESLSESFDVALAEAVVVGGEEGSEGEFSSGREDEGALEDRTLEALAEARGELIDRLLSADDGEDLGPAVEQFVPAILGALRLGIKLVGRPKVVNFLAKYLSQLIGRWVGPTLKGPLSAAIVDTGLRLISLEQPANHERSDEAAPAVLASAIEDTIRRLAESEEYIFEDEDLLQLATAEAFSQSVASYFPARFVRSGLQQAPSIGGSFIPRRPRSIRTYRKYSHVPEIDITSQVADALPSFGGVSVGGMLKAAGGQFPFRARVHIFEAAAGTTLPRLARHDRAIAHSGGGAAAFGSIHPLTPQSAGLLLREPRLGTHVPDGYLRSRHRIAVGQRFYYLEPADAERAGAAVSAAAAAIAGSDSAAPTQGWAIVDLRRSQISIALFISEVEAQGIAAAIKKAQGGAALLGALLGAYDRLERSFGAPNGRVRIVRELEDAEDFAGRSLRRVPPSLMMPLRRRLRAALLPLISDWVRTRSEEFVRAAAHPANGVTVMVILQTVPGLDPLRNALAGRLSKGASREVLPGAVRVAPVGTVTVSPGRRRP